MKLKLLISLLMVSLLLNIGCSSSDEATTEEGAAVSEEEISDTEMAVDGELDGEQAGMAGGEFDEGFEEMAADEGWGEELGGEDMGGEMSEEDALLADLGEEEFGDELSEEELAAAEGEVAAAEGSIEGLEEFDDLGELESFPEEEFVAETDGIAPMEEPLPTADVFAENAEGDFAEDSFADDSFAEPMVEDTSFGATDMAMGTTDSFVQEAPAKKYIPVKKIKDIPFERGGILANTVYLARPGESAESISQKLFGENRVEDIYAVNPHFRGKQIKVGDKVYYNSPKRPNDRENLLTYYEDAGVPAKTYVAKPGDNIREVSEQLLGSNRSWMEVWATNFGVDSKWGIPAGTELRYWDGDVAMGMDMPMAEAEPAMPEPEPAPVEAPSNPVAKNNPPAQMDDFGLPEEPMGNKPMAAAGSTNNFNPPPPPPPAPRKPIRKKIASKKSGGGAMNDKNMQFMILAGGLLFVGLGVLLAIRKRNANKKMSLNAHTQV